ncbi:S24/S26 family peptidase [Pseudoteredinibacter isoporae]|uniref:S24/S26 family peptidase n=1 Tax=Pseudoteredinibacter isoporae TaxID=570281 RepID=UPI00333E523D
MLRLYKVTGDSMAPRFQSGDYLLLSTVFFRLQNEDLLVYQHPAFGAIFKQVSGIENTGFQLRSYNPAGISQEKIGLCNRDRIVGKMLWHFARPS